VGLLSFWFSLPLVLFMLAAIIILVPRIFGLGHFNFNSPFTTALEWGTLGVSLGGAREVSIWARNYYLDPENHKFWKKKK